MKNSVLIFLIVTSLLGTINLLVFSQDAQQTAQDLQQSMEAAAPTKSEPGPEPANIDADDAHTTSASIPGTKKKSRLSRLMVDTPPSANPEDSAPITSDPITKDPLGMGVLLAGAGYGAFSGLAAAGIAGAVAGGLVGLGVSLIVYFLVLKPILKHTIVPLTRGELGLSSNKPADQSSNQPTDEQIPANADEQAPPNI